MLATVASLHVATAATIAGCPLFPPSWSTNQRVDALPVAPDSAAIVRSIGLDGSLKADFGSGIWQGGPIGIPYDVVGRGTRRARVTFEYASESDRVRYPIPRGVSIEGGRGAEGDRHALLVDRRRSGTGYRASRGVEAMRMRTRTPAPNDRAPGPGTHTNQ